MRLDQARSTVGVRRGEEEGRVLRILRVTASAKPLRPVAALGRKIRGMHVQTAMGLGHASHRAVRAHGREEGEHCRPGRGRAGARGGDGRPQCAVCAAQRTSAPRGCSSSVQSVGSSARSRQPYADVLWGFWVWQGLMGTSDTV